MNILLVLEVGHVDTLFLQLLHFRVFFRGVDLVVARDGAFFGGGGSSRHLPVYRLFAGEKGDEGVDLACSRTLSAVRVSVDLFYKIKDTKTLNYDAYNILRYCKYFMLINFQYHNITMIFSAYYCILIQIICSSYRFAMMQCALYHFK